VSETRPVLWWAALKAGRASLAAQSRRIETEAAPIRYVAELVGADTDSELRHSRILCCLCSIGQQPARSWGLLAP
jgi:hypothetical protein